MYPWFRFWAPQLHFPFSGSVAQRIEPDNRMFFDARAELERVLARFPERTPLLTHQPSSRS